MLIQSGLIQQIQKSTSGNLKSTGSNPESTSRNPSEVHVEKIAYSCKNIYVIIYAPFV